MLQHSSSSRRAAWAGVVKRRRGRVSGVATCRTASYQTYTKTARLLATPRTPHFGLRTPRTLGISSPPRAFPARTRRWRSFRRALSPYEDGRCTAQRDAGMAGTGLLKAAPVKNIAWRAYRLTTTRYRGALCLCGMLRRRAHTLCAFCAHGGAYHALAARGRGGGVCGGCGVFRGV